MERYFNSHYEWKFTKPSSVSIALSSDLETKDTLEFIKELNKDTWKILLYPQLPDLIVKKYKRRHWKKKKSFQLLSSSYERDFIDN